MTVSLKLTERIVNDVITKLKAGYATRVATINAEFADSATIAAPASGSYFASGLQHIPDAPAICVVEGRQDFTRDQEGPHGLVSNTEFLVYILDQDPDRQVLGRKLMRHARAVIEVLWDDAPKESLWDGNGGATMNSAFYIHPLRTIPGRVFDPNADDQWRGFYIVVFTARQIEA
jgi:hypothetical protein